MKERTSQIPKEIDKFEHKTNKIISSILPQIAHYLRTEAEIQKLELFALGIPKKDKERAVEAVREWRKEEWNSYLKKYKTEEKAEEALIKDNHITLV